MAILCAVCKVFETKSRVTRSYTNTVGNFTNQNIIQGTAREMAEGMHEREWANGTRERTEEQHNNRTKGKKKEL